MKSIGISLDPFIKSGHLQFYSSRPTLQNLELHFISIKTMVKELKPEFVILDPITNFMSEGPNSGVRLMLTRFVDFLKTQQITVIFTAAITEKLIERNPSDEGISSMVDTWIMVQDAEFENERKRTCTIMKSRGMGHSKMVNQFLISNKGISLSPIPQEETKDREKSKSAKE
jgi:circadian clock protein KaiC